MLPPFNEEGEEEKDFDFTGDCIEFNENDNLELPFERPSIAQLYNRFVDSTYE